MADALNFSKRVTNFAYEWYLLPRDALGECRKSLKSRLINKPNPLSHDMTKAKVTASPKKAKPKLPDRLCSEIALLELTNKKFGKSPIDA